MTSAATVPAYEAPAHDIPLVIPLATPLAIVLMNDCAYGAEQHYLKMRDMPVAMSVFPDIDCAPVAEAFGLQTATVRTLEQLRALAPMLKAPDGPSFIDCKINPAVAAPFLLELVAHERHKA